MSWLIGIGIAQLVLLSIVAYELYVLLSLALAPQMADDNDEPKTLTPKRDLYRSLSD